MRENTLFYKILFLKQVSNKKFMFSIFAFICVLPEILKGEGTFIQNIICIGLMTDIFHNIQYNTHSQKKMSRPYFQM